MGITYYEITGNKEDKDGTLSPTYNHCWLTWQSHWEDEDGVKHWSNEAENFRTIEQAEKVKKELQRHLKSS